MTPFSWLAVALVWWLFFWLYREYRVDLFRQRLFEVRDDLFDLALAGKLSFGSPAYGILRSDINNTIRYGHGVTVLSGLFLFLFTGKDEHRLRLVKERKEAWTRACEQLPDDVRISLESLRFRAGFYILDQVVFTSAILVFSLIALLLWLYLRRFQSAVVHAGSRLSAHTTVRQIVEQFQSAAANSSFAPGA